MISVLSSISSISSTGVSVLSSVSSTGVPPLLFSVSSSGVSGLSSKSTSEEYIMSFRSEQEYLSISNLADSIVPLSLLIISVIVPIIVSLTFKLIVPSSIRNGVLSKETLKFPETFPVVEYNVKVRAPFPSLENIILVTEQLFFEAEGSEAEERTHSPIIASVGSDADSPDPPDPSGEDSCACTVAKSSRI